MTTTTYQALLSLLARIRELEEECRVLRAQNKTLRWELDEGWDPGQ